MGEKRQTLSAGRDTDAPSGQVETPISARPHVFEVLEETGAPGGDTLASHRRSTAGRRDSSYRCLMFFLNWNIVLRLLLSPSSRHTPLSAATSNLSRLHSAFHATVILKAGGSEDFLMWYFSTIWFFFFSLSLSCSSVFSTMLTFDGNKIQTPKMFFFLFSTEAMRQFWALSSFSSSVLWQKVWELCDFT